MILSQYRKVALYKKYYDFIKENITNIFYKQTKNLFDILYPFAKIFV